MSLAELEKRVEKLENSEPTYEFSKKAAKWVYQNRDYIWGYIVGFIVASL